MNVRKMSIGLGILLSLGGNCFASEPAVQRLIHFQGAIVEAPCVVSEAAKGLALNACPAAARSVGVSALSVERVGSVSSLEPTALKVKLLVESNEDRGMFTRQYALLDADDKPVRSGDYRVTLTYP
ncbi:type 1 fimbrial protein [Pseudomonas sp. NFX98]|uniref:type 1 fimbrial protein n=1 Tax=Pseudomonas sp. NFX98 TaxID=3399122 RepID=UPI0039FC25AC